MRNEFPVLAWLLTWIAGISLFLGPTLAISFVSTIRSMRRDGIPRPLFVALRRLLSALPLPATSTEAIEGREAFVAWDRRWMDAGQTTATVIRVIDPDGELQLELDRPIGHVRVTMFRPNQPSHASYRLSAVRGTLSRVDDVTPTAEVVVYPASVKRRLVGILPRP